MEKEEKRRRESKKRKRKREEITRIDYMVEPLLSVQTQAVWFQSSNMEEKKRHDGREEGRGGKGDTTRGERESGEKEKREERRKEKREILRRQRGDRGKGLCGCSLREE